jgi:hypothetical protein
MALDCSRMAGMPEIFLSYRRADAAASTGRLYDHLARHFGAEQIFRDIDSIDAGEDFERSIRVALEDAAAVLIIIGRDWLALRSADGTPRLEEPGDYVRREIELALASNALVVPVLVDTAAFPEAHRLPATIQGLARRNAVELTHRHWQRDTEALMQQLEMLGIAAVEPPADRSSAERGLVVGAVAAFFPDLLHLMRRPRAFLRGRTRGTQILARALLFYALTAMLAVITLAVAYMPRQPMGFAGSVIIGGFLLMILLSLPLWLGWRLVGARRHYSRLLCVASYQAGVLHLFAFVAMAIVIVGIDLQARDVFQETVANALAPGRSLDSAMEVIEARLVPLVITFEFRIALLVATAFAAGGFVWLVYSWSAYRDAFGFGRARSIAATAIAAVALTTAVFLVGAIV